MIKASEQRASDAQEWVVSTYVLLSDVEKGLVCSSKPVLQHQSHRKEITVVTSQ